MSLSRRDRAIAERFSWGTTPDLLKDVRRAGGGREWFQAQTRPGRIKDPRRATLNRWYPSLRRNPGSLLERSISGKEPWWEVMEDFASWTVLMRAGSRRQAQEVMTDFWSNLLHVPLMDGDSSYHRMRYDAMLRRLAFSSYEKILYNAVTHPAMGIYLDNAVSTKHVPNENLGRELLELHTVGRTSGYTEKMVKDSARILTGWQVDDDTMAPYYNPMVHATGRVKVLGFTHPNRSRNGKAVTRAYLKYLAHHPSTARRIATRLCVRFVSDNPSPDLVATVARAYRRHDTEIVPTLQAMIDHPAFLRGKRVRTPGEAYVATLRRLRIHVGKPKSDSSFAHALNWQMQSLAFRPFDWPAPNGLPEPGSAWTSAGRVLASAELNRVLANGWWPSERATFRDGTDWLSEKSYPITVDKAISKIAKKLFGHDVSRATRKGVARANGMTPTTVLDSSSAWPGRVLGLVAALLDSPDHLVRR